MIELQPGKGRPVLPRISTATSFLSLWVYYFNWPVRTRERHSVGSSICLRLSSLRQLQSPFGVGLVKRTRFLTRLDRTSWFRMGIKPSPPSFGEIQIGIKVSNGSSSHTQEQESSIPFREAAAHRISQLDIHHHFQRFSTEFLDVEVRWRGCSFVKEAGGRWTLVGSSTLVLRSKSSQDPKPIHPINSIMNLRKGVVTWRLWLRTSAPRPLHDCDSCNAPARHHPLYFGVS